MSSSPTPSVLESWMAQAVALHQQGQLARAVSIYQQVLKHAPQHHGALHMVGVALLQNGQAEEALSWLQRSVDLADARPEYWRNLAEALRQSGQLEAAIDAARRAVTLDPQNGHGLYNLGLAQQGQGDLDAARETYLQALQQLPDYSPAWNNLGVVCRSLGLHAEAIAAYRQLLQRQPHNWLGHSNLIFALHQNPDAHHDELAEAYAAFRRDCEAKISAPPLQASRPGNQRLRIGYLSNDFYQHAVMHFIEPVLCHHDRDRFDITLYSYTTKPDAATERLKRLGHRWCEVATLSDDALAAQIRQDQIDILIDLKGHTDHHRLGVFARRAAPLQITWMGFPGSTGLAAMDGWISDATLAQDLGEQPRSEQILPLPRFHMVYRPHPHCPDVAPLPALRNGFLTFGSFNSWGKLGEPTLALWRRLLQRLPDSRLLLAAVPVGQSRQRVLAFFAEAGIGPERLQLHGRLSESEFLALHGAVDIALDPYPYGGATTTLAGLWMGVPPLTRYGKNHRSRVGLSILHCLGIKGFAAADEEAWLELAAALPGRIQELAQLRSDMRQRLQGSPLLDEAGFTRELEDAYREFWLSHSAA
ncbi:tetratricopeptide repeat protein [Chitinimonas sp. DQS-5]|uniref:protein O-GlcNAc transferase n=2 Tax=Parachitinimonas caeni TaxID=3031301 RepID=A0ABT7E2E3_9NEIS|nr:tetratricopeptide repeat protein [Parachitinimonas caeni]MDK2126419.1 tetratricopeptide repeat protein [Parachitinimonas caeni]